MRYAARLGALARWSALGMAVGLVSGAASALFLHALTRATSWREAHPWLLFLLPVAGAGIAWIYERFGKSVAGGNNLLLERIHAPEATAIPFRLAPLVLLGTVLTHLFGGSAGREGTAVQMGGTLANLATAPLRLSVRDHRILILSGISGGFGSVFGTPLAGAVFGLEVSAPGRLRYEALLPCLVASLVGDLVCRALGIEHHVYRMAGGPNPLTPLRWALILLAGALFAGAATGFVRLTEAIAHVVSRVARPELRAAFGGLAVVGLTYAVGSRDYLGLSLPLIERSFTPAGVVLWAFALKLLFTSITLGTGFKGGEVTPLFAIGAALGAAFAQVTGQPTGLFAALGLVAVFGAAANTPLACTVLGIELFGAEIAVPLAAACVVAFSLSGQRGIYSSQRVETEKGPCRET